MKYFEICGVSTFGEDDVTVLVSALNMESAIAIFISEYPAFTVRVAAESEISEVIDQSMVRKDK